MAPARPVGVLALQGGVREHRRILADEGVDTLEVRLPADLERVGSLVLPGGESTAISLLLRSSGLLEPLRGRLAAGMPALGTCAGMILLARCVVDGRQDQEQLEGLDIVVRRNAFGSQVDSFETDVEVEGMDGGPLHAVFIRAPVVESAGPAVEVLARVERAGELRPVVCRQGPVIVAAFHPELAGDPRLHRMFLHEVDAA